MKKGFTLVELLAVIIIIGALAIIIVPTVKNIINKSAEVLKEEQIRAIEDAARQWGTTSNLETLPGYVSIKTLQDDGYLDNRDILDPETDDVISGGVIINYSNNQYVYKYMDGVILYYDGINHGANPAIWTDLSGNNDGNLTSFNFNNNSGWTDEGLKFDGIDDYVIIPEISNLTLPATYHFKIKFSFLNNYNIVFGNGMLRTGLGYFLAENSFISTTVNRKNIFLSGGLETDTFVNLTVTYDSAGNPSQYLNGVSLSQSSLLNLWTWDATDTNTYIGKRVITGSSPYPLNGTIQSVIIFNKPLTLDEINHIQS